MITLYENVFSPFSRKVRMVIEYKGLDATYIDGLNRDNHAALNAVNTRMEVPALLDDDLVVVNSADIVAYLDHRYPDRPVLPTDPALRVGARAWERAADSAIDPILVDISIWIWAERNDTMPDGLLEAGRRDLSKFYHALERQLGDDEYFMGDISIADFALFPHLRSAATLGAPIDATLFPKLSAWLTRFNALDIAKRDTERLRSYLQNIGTENVEREKIFWRGDRIEWLLANGYHEWFVKEIDEGRMLWPSPGVPAT